NDLVTVSGRSFNTEDTKKYAGSLGDPSRMAQNFAGVSAANDSRNDIIVRGNSPNALLWQFEGLNIQNPNHFGALNSTGGPVSMLNNNNLDKSDFLTSAFPASYGNATASVFDVRLRNGNSEKHEFIGQVGFNGFEFGAEGPLGGGASYIASYRYSTLGVFKALGINFGTGTAVPNYQDLNVKLNVPLSDQSKLFVFGMGGRSDVEFLADLDDTTSKNFYSRNNENNIAAYRSGVAGIGYEHTLSDATFLRVVAGASGTFENFKNDSVDALTRSASLRQTAEFSTNRYSIHAMLRHKFSSQFSITAGVMNDNNGINIFNRRFYGDRSERIFVNTNERFNLLQSYAQAKYRLSDALTANLGLHTQHTDLGNHGILEPRAGLQYTLGESIISVGYGLHSQMQSPYTYFVETPTSNGITYTNRNLDFTKSHHGVIGYEWFPAKDWRVKAEAYYQSLFDAPVTQTASSFSAINTGGSFAPPNTDSLVNNGTGRNIGAELTVEKFFSNSFYLLATLSLFDSKYKGSDGVERNTAYNMGYVANLLAGKEWLVGTSDVLGVNLRVSSTGGRHLTPFDVAASRLRGETVFDESRAYSQRQTAYFRMDVKLSYRMEFAHSTMEWSVDLQNITGNQNIFSQTINPATGEITTNYQLGFFPVPTFRWTF
ncbi:MAG: TonB-dependent receptor, partial [Candidatus Kapabacteria bacterium]|nr:TonB-dependent receptor [Candidatus Kapabacteria bacterium]